MGKVCVLPFIGVVTGAAERTSSLCESSSLRLESSSLLLESSSLLLESSSVWLLEPATSASEL